MGVGPLRAMSPPRARLVDNQLGRLPLDDTKAVKVVRNIRVLKDRPGLGQNLSHRVASRQMVQDQGANAGVAGQTHGTRCGESSNLRAMSVSSSR